MWQGTATGAARERAISDGHRVARFRRGRRGCDVAGSTFACLTTSRPESNTQDRAELKTGSGSVQVGRIGGTAVVKNSNGDTWMGEVAGELRVSATNGTWPGPRPDRLRQGRHRNLRGRRRLAGPQQAVRQRAERPGRRPSVPNRAKTRSRCTPAVPSATSPSAAPHHSRTTSAGTGEVRVGAHGEWTSTHGRSRPRW